MARLRRRFGAPDEGAVTLMIVIMAISILAMIGLAVDGGGRMRAIERADNVAAEAARAGGQAIDLPKAIAGTADVVNPADAVAAAKVYLAQAGVNGTVVVSADRRELTVTVYITYDPVLLDIIGAGPWTETGSATAELLTG